MTTEAEHIRRFDRTWTEVFGALDQGMSAARDSPAEARTILELALHDQCERRVLRDRMDIDSSYLSRILNRLTADGMVRSTRSEVDRRAVVLSLTDVGRRAAATMGRRSEAQIDGLLAPFSPDERAQLVEAMSTIASLVRPTPDREVIVRGLRAGDLGWVVGRHGAVYADEFGWDTDFEALVAEIALAYHRDWKPGREQAWIAEVDGARAGCVFCCQREADTAQLRILLVERWARGLGIGSRLVDECIRFARQAGYRTVMLWTNDVLVSARRIYEAAGFVLIDSEPHHSFGHDLVGQNWELDLTASDTH